jgi:hypothetical protein
MGCGIIDAFAKHCHRYFHDHLFVPEGKEQHVVEILRSMAEDARTGQ